MKVEMSGEIWSNALFFRLLKNAFQAEEFFSVCLLRNPHPPISLFPSISISNSSLSPSLQFFRHSLPFSNFCSLSLSPCSTHPQGTIEVNTPEKLYSPELLSQSHLQTNSLCCAVALCIIKSQLC